jgi:hypothetical protein
MTRMMFQISATDTAVPGATLGLKASAAASTCPEFRIPVPIQAPYCRSVSPSAWPTNGLMNMVRMPKPRIVAMA